MAISLRTRLTLWYSAWLLVALALFTATVLWLHWRLLLHQADESLEAFSTAAANVVSAGSSPSNSQGSSDLMLCASNSSTWPYSRLRRSSSACSAS